MYFYDICDNRGILMKKVIKMMFGVVVMSLFLTACGSSDSSESKFIGVWKLEEPDDEVIYLEFTDDRLVVRELDGKMSSLHYYITELQNKSFLLEASISDGGFKEIILEGIFQDKNTIGVLHNPSSRYRYEDNEVKMYRVKNLEKDMEEETEKLSVIEEEEAWEDDEDFSQEPTDEEIAAMEEKAREKEAKDKEAMEKEAARENEATAVENLYAKSCAGCHGRDLTGSAGPDISSVGSNMSAEEIEKVIIDGTSVMPGGLLSDEEAKEVAEWLSKMN